jgi:uncharacterized membrane protein
MGLGALPVFWLAKERLENEFVAFVFAVAYLLFPPLGFANADEFHAVAMAPTLLLFAFYFAHRAHSETGKSRKKNYLRFALFAILAMSCKEEISLLVFMIGLYMLLAQKERRVSIVTMAVSVIWFYIAVYVIIPYYEKTDHPFLSFYTAWGRNPLEIAFYLLTHPKTAWQFIVTKPKLAYLYSLLAPLGFLPLFGPRIMILALPSLGINLLSSNPGMHQAHAPAHYIAPIVPFMVIASIWGASFLGSLLASKLKIQRRLLIYLLTGLVAVSSLYHHYHHGLSPLARGFRFHPVTPHDRLIDELVDLIPPDAAVATTHQVNSHLTRRERVYPLPDINDAHYVLMDITPTSSPLFTNDLYLLFQDLVEHKGFGILASKDGYILLKRGEANRHLSHDFYSFVREPNPSIQYPMRVNFGNSLQLTGFNVIQDKMGTAYLELYFQALQEMECDYQFFTFITDDEGEIILDPDEHLLEGIAYQPSDQLAAPVWYPTSQWEVGELIKIETLHWATSLPLRFGIALGVADGLGQWEIDKRLRPEVIESGIVMPLLYDDTLLELLTVESDGRIVEGVVQERLFSTPAIQHPLEANLDDQVKFLGYDLDDTSAKPGGNLHLTLYWQALTEIDESYTVFTHLLAGDNRIWGQKDSTPGGGTRPTTNWVQGEVIMDKYDIPIQDNAPSGQYILEIGMYQLKTGQRLPIVNDEGQVVGDRVLLREITIKRKQ